MNVLLPQPEGPITAVIGVLADVHRDARERERLAVPDAEVLDREDGRAAGDLGERLGDRLLRHVDLHALCMPGGVRAGVRFHRGILA